MPGIYDLDDEIEQFKSHLHDNAANYMPSPVLVDVIDGTQQYQRGWVWGKHGDKTIQVIIPGNFDVRGATTASPQIMWAFAPNPNSPSNQYFAVGYSINTSGLRIPNSRVGVMTVSSLAMTASDLDAGTTKITPGGVDKWMKAKVDGTTYYIPMYTSKTT